MSAPSIEPFELEVCVDCYLYAGMATEPGTSTTAQDDACTRIQRDNGDARITLYAGSLEGDEGEGPEPHFSWSPCEFCLSTLGGDRYPITVVGY